MASKQNSNTTRVVELDAQSFPTLEEINQVYIGSSNPQPIHRNRGSVNQVSIYRNAKGQKIAIRVALEPTNLLALAQREKQWAEKILQEKQSVHPDTVKAAESALANPNIPTWSYGQTTLALMSLMRQQISATNWRNEEEAEAQQSLMNWVTAAELGLSPHLLFYGYVTIGPQGGGAKYLCAVSEGFDMDLGLFYSNRTKGMNWAKGATDLVDIDIIIQQQLSALLTKLSQSPLFLICFDIKPLNCVINFSQNSDKSIIPESIIVKLIDWDGDWCRKYDMLKKGASGVAPLAQFTGLMSQIVMANHFYMPPINFNIFYKFFVEKEDEMESIKDSLSVLFCNQREGDYNLMANHYFKIIAPSCEQLFTTLYDRSFLLKSSTSASSKSGGGIFSSSSGSSSSGLTSGGRRKKYKKRRRTKRRKRRKIKKRRRRKTKRRKR